MTDTTEQIRIPYKAFIAAAARAFQVTPMDVEGPCRKTMFVRARQTAMVLIREHRKDASLPEIGRRCGGRDHTTVLHAMRAVERLRKYDEGFASCYLAAEQDVLSWRPGQARDAVFTIPAPKEPAKLGRPPLVKFGPPAPIRLVSPREGRSSKVDYHGREIDAEWWATNDRRFKAAMLRAHPERAPAGMREAAE